MDDDYGVITAQTTTPGDIEENVQLDPIIDQHEANVGHPLKTVVGDKQYGTVENYRQLQKRGLNTHMDHGNPGNKKALAAIYPRVSAVKTQTTDRLYPLKIAKNHWIYAKLVDFFVFLTTKKSGHLSVTALLELIV